MGVFFFVLSRCACQTAGGGFCCFPGCMGNEDIQLVVFPESPAFTGAELKARLAEDFPKPRIGRGSFGMCWGMFCLGFDQPASLMFFSRLRTLQFPKERWAQRLYRCQIPKNVQRSKQGAHDWVRGRAKRFSEMNQHERWILGAYNLFDTFFWLQTNQSTRSFSIKTKVKQVLGGIKIILLWALPRLSEYINME